MTCKNCEPFLLEMANRLHAASSVLGRLAERDSRVAEVLRLRRVLERIADGCLDPRGVAREGLK